jgi:hypothetical protein
MDRFQRLIRIPHEAISFMLIDFHVIDGDDKPLVQKSNRSTHRMHTVARSPQSVATLLEFNSCLNPCFMMSCLLLVDGFIQVDLILCFSCYDTYPIFSSPNHARLIASRGKITYFVIS